MEAKLVLQAINYGRRPFSTSTTTTATTGVCRRQSSPNSINIVSVLTTTPPPPAPADNNNNNNTNNQKYSSSSRSRSSSSSSNSSVYNDNWLELFAINYLSHCVQASTGMRNKMSGYEGLVEASKVATQNFNTTQQRQIVIEALGRAFPKPILSLMRMLLPQSQFAREYFAVFTTIFFAWLVGPCEVKESEIDGRREKNVVHIKKCRFLEESNCVGMCINLCKMPTQTFIKDSLGMPMNMVPNFDDMSCEMIFGQNPPASIDDPALNQPCYNFCKTKRKHNTNCNN